MISCILVKTSHDTSRSCSFIIHPVCILFEDKSPATSPLLCSYDMCIICERNSLFCCYISYTEVHSLTHSFTHSLTHSLTHACARTHTHTHTHTHIKILIYHYTYSCQNLPITFHKLITLMNPSPMAGNLTMEILQQVMLML
jgi:hypothetical protein